MDTNKQFPVLFPADLGFPELSFGNAPLTLNLQGLDGTYGTGFLKEEEGLSQSDKIYPANSDNADDERRDDSASPTSKQDRNQKQNKQYTCETCGQAFTQVSNLKRHERLHTGEKPFVCEVCKKSFSTLSNLKQHQQTHEDSSERTKFECHRCNKSYFYQSSLNKHMKSHEKTDARSEFDKDFRSLSPKKGAPARIQIPKQDSPSWETSHEVFSDVSPTSKKLKKENKAGQLTPATTSETNNGLPVAKNIEEEFITQYNKNLAKVLSHNAHSFDFNPMNSLLNLQYLSIADPQPMLFPNSAYTTGALPIQPNQNDFMKLFPGHQLTPTGGYQPGLNNPNETYFLGPQYEKQALQSETLEPYKPIYNFLGQELFQKPRNGSLDYQNRNSIESNGQQSLGFSVDFGDKEQGPTTNISNELPVNTKSEFQEQQIPNSNQMEVVAGITEYDIEQYRESRRRSSLEGEFGGYMLSDRLFGYGLQKEASDSNVFLKEELDNGCSMDFFH